MPARDLGEIRDILGYHFPELGSDLGPNAELAYEACTRRLDGQDEPGPARPAARQDRPIRPAAREGAPDLPRAGAQPSQADRASAEPRAGQAADAIAHQPYASTDEAAAALAWAREPYQAILDTEADRQMFGADQPTLPAVAALQDSWQALPDSNLADVPQELAAACTAWAERRPGAGRRRP